MGKNTQNTSDTQKTYGEKVHSRIFDKWINFGLNLGASAWFTYWVKHSTKPIWKNAPVKKGPWKDALSKSPSAFYEQVVGVFQKSSIMKVSKTEKGKRGIAEAMANILTLNFAGHGIIIPSVWLGEKYKTRMIKNFDRKHYGDESQQPEWVKARHFDIQNAPKPSFLGAVVSRTGTMFATMAAAYTLGAQDNVIKALGKKTNSSLLQKFNGLDPTSEKWGVAFGKKLKSTIPNKTNAQIDQYVRNKGFGYSIEQASKATGLKTTENFKQLEKLRGKKTGLKGKKYGGLIPDFTRFTFLDTMTTMVTAVVIGPMTRAVKKLPGMSYKQTDEAKKQRKTFGERVHGLFTYVGVDFVLNAAIGATFVFGVNRTKWGKKIFADNVERLIRPITGLFLKGKALDISVKGGQELVSIAFGGTMINPLLTRLEKPKNKKKIIKKINTTYYGKERVENDERFKEVDKRIEAEPDKNLSAAWTSRIISLVPIYAIASYGPWRAFATKNNVPILKHISLGKISSYSKNAAESLGIKPGGWWKQKPIIDGKMQTSNWQALHDFVGFDFGLTPYYAVMHAATFPIIAKRKGTSSNKQEKPDAEKGAVKVTEKRQKKRSKDLDLVEQMMDQDRYEQQEDAAEYAKQDAFIDTNIQDDIASSTDIAEQNAALENDIVAQQIAAEQQMIAQNDNAQHSETPINSVSDATDVERLEDLPELQVVQS